MAHEELFDRARLKRASVNGAAVNLGSQLTKFGMLFVYQIVLARMLSPSDFGLIAMTAPVIAFVQIFSDFGLTQATIQRSQISQSQLTLLFWINGGVGTALALIVIVFSPLAGMFYNESRVVAITAASGALFLLSGFSSQHLALLNRHLSFIKLAIIDIGAFVIGSAAGLYAAYRGAGYWSILLAQAFIAFSTLVLAWSLSGWRPGRPAKAEEWKSLVGFGGNLTGFNLVNYFARNLDNILIGRYNGQEALGLYDRAYKLLLMPLSQITQPFSRVALPLLSRTQNEPDIYRRAYIRMLEIILLLTYPGILFAVVTHDQLIRLVLGEQWAGVGPIFAILGIGALFAPISNSTGWLFISQDRTRQMRNWGVISSIMFVFSFIAGLPWGPIGVAACYIGTGMFQGPMVWYAATREGPVGLKDILNALMPHAFAGILCCAALMILQSYIPIGYPALVLMFAAAYLVFISALMIFPSGRGILQELSSYAWALLGKLRLFR
jgi:PST family polysaccharide transporter